MSTCSRSAEDTPYGVDVQLLRITAADRTVLVRSKGKKLITVAEYNAWLGSYPLNITSQDPAKGRRQAVEQMARFKLISRMALEAGYQNRMQSSGADSSEKARVLSYIKDQMFNVAAVTDREARDYSATHSDTLSQIESADVPPEVKLMGVKSTILGERLKKRVDLWMERERITYDDSALH